MDHGPPTTKSSRSTSTSWHPRLGPWTEHGAWAMNRPCAIGWAMDHGPPTTKSPVQPPHRGIPSWTMDRTWSMDHESTMRHWMGHGQWTTYDKKSSSASTSWHPRLGPWTEDGAWTMNRPCTMDHEATMNPRNPWKP